MAIKKRSFFGVERSGNSTNTEACFMLRWFEERNDDVLQEGPFYSLDAALGARNDKLTPGICSWLVKYND